MKTLLAETGREEIRNRILSLKGTDTRHWGKMSLDQMICHVADSYEAGMGTRTVSPASGFVQRTLVKWVALKSPLPWPKGVPTRPEVEPGKGGSVPLPFVQNRDRLLLLYDRFYRDLVVPCVPHPIFGPMTLEDWHRWGYLHADHHLRQFGR